MTRRDESEILVVPLVRSLIATLRRTFPARPTETLTTSLRARERVLRGAGVCIADVVLDRPSEGRPPEETLIAAEVAYVVGALGRCDGVLLARDGAALRLADRVVASGRREHLPDLPSVGRLADIGVAVGTVEDEAAWVCVEWLMRRLAPHRVWLVQIPPHRGAQARERRGESHRALRELLATFAEQCR